MRDDLGDRMKRSYETRTRFFLPRRTFTLIRVDGRAFYNYTRTCARPFDIDLMADMDATAVALCQEISGARLAYVQSDEISVLATDFESTQTEAWFDGNIQKMASISASVATAAFNAARLQRGIVGPWALFDSRVWTIPDRQEVFNYFVWRQQDASRNSVAMSARAHFSAKQLDRLTYNQMQELLWQEKQVNWNDMPVGFKRGRVIVPVPEVSDIEYIDRRTREKRIAAGVVRRSWAVVEPPIFTQDREWLLQHIPCPSMGCELPEAKESAGTQQ